MADTPSARRFASNRFRLRRRLLCVKCRVRPALMPADAWHHGWHHNHLPILLMIWPGYGAEPRTIAEMTAGR